MLDEIEKWVVEHYGEITSESVEFPQFTPWGITAAAVRTFNGLTIGMGRTRQMAIHDLYLRLTQKPDLPTALDGFWFERFQKSR